MIPIREHEGAISFQVKVHPRPKRDAIAGETGDALKLALTAPPVNGRANAACIGFLAKLLKVPRSSITIASGEHSRLKVVRISGITAEKFRERIASKD